MIDLSSGDHTLVSYTVIVSRRLNRYCVVIRDDSLDIAKFEVVLLDTGTSKQLTSV